MDAVTAAIRGGWRALPQGRVARVAFVAIAAAAAILRIRYCFLSPANLTDILRHLAFGVGVREFGLGYAGEPLAEMAPPFARLPWAGNPYNYPPVALAFFAFVAFVHASPLAAKIALTLVDAANATLAARLTRDPWCGLCAWAAPLGVWWVSREGQFEGVQSLLALLALAALDRRRPFAAFLLLALAIQTKVTAFVLFPTMTVLAWRGFPPAGRARGVGLCVAGFAIGCLPTAIASVYYPVVSNVLRYSTPMRINVFHWSLDGELVRSLPTGVLVWQQVAAWILCAILVVGTVRSRRVAEFLPAILFAVLMRTRDHVLFWYWLAMLPALVLLPDVRLRRLAFVVWAAMEAYAATQIAVGPYSSQVSPEWFADGPSATVDSKVIVPPP